MENKGYQVVGAWRGGRIVLFWADGRWVDDPMAAKRFYGDDFSKDRTDFDIPKGCSQVGPVSILDLVKAKSGKGFIYSGE